MAGRSNLPVVSNSSPLIGLEQIRQIGILHSLFGEVLVPTAVASEIAGSVTMPAWIKSRPLSEPLPRETERRSLGPGEREAIALAIECGAKLLIVDDDPARRIAERLGVPIIGTIGVLLLAKERALLKAVKPQLDALVSNRFFVSQTIYDLALSKSGEI